MSNLKWLTAFLMVIIGFLSIWIGISIKNYNVLKGQRNNCLIQLDSLIAENKKLVSQLDYLELFYDSTKKRIPEPTGFAFIGDSVIGAAKELKNTQ